MKIGWIGLGHIGTQMVKRALAGGYRVTAYSRGAGLAEVVAAGAQSCDDYPALAAESDILVVCVYSDAQVRAVLFELGVLAALRSGSVLAIHTTGSPELAREIGRRAPKGVDVLDATFSGGPHTVAAGSLSVMLGGAPDAVKRVSPLFATYADRIQAVGPLGSAQLLKLLNNLLFATNLKHAAELMKIASDLGFDTPAVAKVVQSCSGASFAMSLFERAMPATDALARARPFLEKDVATAVATAAEMKLALGVFAATAEYFSPQRQARDAFH